MTSRAPLWYHGWNVVGACVLAQVMALGLTFNCFSLFIIDWTHEFHVSVSAIAISVTIFSIGCMATSPFFGIVADRYPARWVYGLALAGLAAAHIAMSFVTALWQIVAIYAVIFPLVIAPASSIEGQALVSRWFQRRVGLAMGLTAFGAVLGGVILPPIIVALAPAVGWRWMWRLFALLIALVAIPLIVSIARDRPRPEERPGYAGDVQRVRAKSTLRFGEILTRRNFWVTIGMFLAVQGAFLAMSVNMAPFAISRGHGAAVAGWLMSLMSIAALASKLGSGMLADRLGNRMPLTLAPLLCATGLATLALGPNSLPVLAIGVILVGTAGAAWTLLASATAAEFGAQGFGRAFGLISALTPLGTLAPPLLAKMNETNGGYTAGLLTLAMVAIVGAAIGALFDQKHASTAKRNRADVLATAESLDVA